jgi:hypothetical protein
MNEYRNPGRDLTRPGKDPVVKSLSGQRDDLFESSTSMLEKLLRGPVGLDEIHLVWLQPGLGD